MSEAAGGEASRHSPIQAEHPGGRQNAQQTDEAHDERGRELVQRAHVERMKELRSALKTHCIDEQSKKYVLNAAIDIDAKLSDHDADQERSGDAA